MKISQIGLEILLLLFAGTGLFTYLTILIYKRSREISYILGFGALFIWTIAGGWLITIDRLTLMRGMKFGLHYYGYFEKLFPVYLDLDYFLAILYYFVFLFVIQITILFSFKKRKQESPVQNRPIFVQHWKFQLLSLFAVAMSFLTIYDTFRDASVHGKSLYITIHSTENIFFSLHQLLNQVALLSLIIGFLVFLSGKKGILFVGKSGKVIMFLYLFLMILVEVYLTIIGNKHEMFFGIIFGFLFYIGNAGKNFSLSRLGLFIIIVAVPMTFTDLVRGNPVNKFFSNIGEVSIVVPNSGHNEKEDELTKKYGLFPGFNGKRNPVITKVGSILFSNELFCSHMSMYGVLKNNVPITYGTSFIYLAESLIPKPIYNNRSPDIYQYYSEKVNAAPGQGYTINHATGWYLNFGIVGIIIGAMILGLLWRYALIIRATGSTLKSRFLRIFCFVFLIGLTAFIPTLIRAGPECYKSLIFEGILIPVMIIFIASCKNVPKLNGPMNNDVKISS